MAERLADDVARYVRGELSIEAATRFEVAMFEDPVLLAAVEEEQALRHGMTVVNPAADSLEVSESSLERYAGGVSPSQLLLTPGWSLAASCAAVIFGVLLLAQPSVDSAADEDIEVDPMVHLSSVLELYRGAEDERSTELDVPAELGSNDLVVLGLDFRGQEIPAEIFLLRTADQKRVALRVPTRSPADGYLGMPVPAGFLSPGSFELQLIGANGSVERKQLNLRRSP